MNLFSIVDVGVEAEAEYNRVCIAAGDDEPDTAVLDRLSTTSALAAQAAAGLPAAIPEAMLAKVSLLAAMTRELTPNDPAYLLAQSLLRDLRTYPLLRELQFQPALRDLQPQQGNGSQLGERTSDQAAVRV